MKKVTIFDELKRSWAITLNDMRVYYLRPPSLMFGILFPIALFFSFSVGRRMPVERLIPVLSAQTVFWASSSIGPASIPMERRMRTFERFLSAPISLSAVLWGKAMGGLIFGVGVTSIAAGIGIVLSSQNMINPTVFMLGIILSALAFSALGILFASIPTESPGEIMMPFNFVRIPLMFISGMFIPLSELPELAVDAAFFSPLTHTLDLVRLGMGEVSYFGWEVNMLILILWSIVFLVIGSYFHRLQMKNN
ncbi:ABC transporter permease [Candidatus Bathyarchaeota archaeon]|mgnify:FL=1|jgi:ABC-2 type transport system permease protein|nr:ABC transporter permease [Candidatus Bathyarchaeota archaeon]MBT4321173.1 ABC transporter permease [Candidatus Bathyarchaeota archaeon]MBT4424530.1 ABC transporter permease [Candidatus Bathyarchaeota archaeon]MBT5641669.1 ABC transporter permease [Candidatus Bathyarchaeota archaeon]MBT6605709.1 ABC transporter permease [Candidatus Bathyarchaeota archaeon]